MNRIKFDSCPNIKASLFESERQATHTGEQINCDWTFRVNRRHSYFLDVSGSNRTIWISGKCDTSGAGLSKSTDPMRWRLRENYNAAWVAPHFQSDPEMCQAVSLFESRPVLKRGEHVHPPAELRGRAHTSERTLRSFCQRPAKQSKNFQLLDLHPSQRVERHDSASPFQGPSNGDYLTCFEFAKAARSNYSLDPRSVFIRQ